MANKKSKFLLYISCLLLLSAIGIILGLHFQTQPVYAVTNETSIREASEQDADILTADDIFENYTQTSLKEEFKDSNVLDELKNTNQISEDEYDRAVDVMNGEVRYTPKREFSSKFENDRKIDQVGDIAAYSKNELNCIWAASELILTGIYGIPEYTFNVFVEANDTTDELPYIIFSQNHGYYSHWFEKYKLQNGWNKLTFPTFGRSLVAQNEILGGAVYLCNPYTTSQGDVSVYIEGGGYYPVFRKGGNEEEFLNFLKEYEEGRETNDLLNMAELVTDHAIISTTSDSLYDVYFHNDVITPSENLELWGNYFTTLFEFNGIPTSEDSLLDVPYDSRNDHVKINFRYMTYYSGSGAYSYSYHIGWYYEHYWFANFYNAKNPIRNHPLSEHLIFGIGHELGHALDNEPRKINETTNNFTAAMAYFKVLNMPHYEQYQPFEKTLKALASDYTLDYKAYDDGQIMYTKSNYPSNYDHNYLIWWDLEAVFPGFWARLNNYFRKPLESGLSKTEQYVYYSSLATGVDLSTYYERWGFYDGKSPTYWQNRFTYENASQKFKTLMQEAITSHKISKQYDHFWYVDAEQYNFALEHQNVSENDRAYTDGKPTISKIVRSGNKRTVFIQSEKSENHLGYEVLSKTAGNDWKIAGFTYSSLFVDENYYSSDPTYKVVAVNRFFQTSEASEARSDVSTGNTYVCRIETQNYSSLKSAIENAADGQTIYLLEDCVLENVSFSRKLTIAVDPSVQNDIVISANKSYIQFNNDFKLIGRNNARIIIDGKSLEATNPLLYGARGTFVGEYVTFQGLRTKFLAAVIYALGADVEISNCIFDNCKDLKADGVIKATQKLKIENCTFTNITEDYVNISNIEDLTLLNTINVLTLNFGDFDDKKIIQTEGDFSKENFDKIKLKPGYMMEYSNGQLCIQKLKFTLSFFETSDPFRQEVETSSFVFGSEGHDYHLSENQYVQYTDKKTNKIYLTDDKIQLENDMEFDIEIKNKLEIKMFYDGGNDARFYRGQEFICLPTVDAYGKRVFAYLDEEKIYYPGQIYKVEKAASLTAIYEGNLVCRYIVGSDIYDAIYGKYNAPIKLIDLQDEEFLGWRCGNKIISGDFVLQGDTDLIAVFGELPQVYDLSQCEIDIDGSYTYSGESITPQIVVSFNGLIVPSDRYAVTYSNNIAASNLAQVTITAVDSLSTGSKTQTFTIDPKRLEDNDVNVTGLQNFVYNGIQTDQVLTINYKDKQIGDFTIDYIGDRINAGNVQIKITFSGNYTGEISLEYTISKAERADFKVFIDDWVYGQSGASPRVENVEEQATVSYLYSTEENGTYVLSKPTNAGVYWIKAVIEQSRNYNSAESQASFVIAKADHPDHMPDETMMIGRKAKTLVEVALNTAGWQWEAPNTVISAETMTAWAVYSDTANYEHCRIEITITKEAPKECSKLDVGLDVETYIYDGSFKLPNVIAKDDGVTLTLGVDFDVRYENNINAGKGKAIVAFKNDYTGSMTLEFTISKAEKLPVDSTTIRLDHKVSQLSDISLPDGFFWENEDMEITSDTVTAKALYVGDDADNYITKEISFVIIIDITTKDSNSIHVTLENDTFVYDGQEKKPNVIAEDDGVMLTLGADFDVQYQSNINAGKGKAIVTFKNEYSGTREFEFTILRAEKPRVDNTKIQLEHKVAKLSDIQLPSGFVWENEDMEITSDTVTARAIYMGDDADNYMTKEISFVIVIEIAQNEPTTNILTWLAIFVPIGALLVAGGAYAIVRHKRKMGEKV